MAQWVKELAINPDVLNFILRTLLEKKTEPWKLFSDPLTILWYACCHTHSFFFKKKYEQWLHFSVDLANIFIFTSQIMHYVLEF